MPIFERLVYHAMKRGQERSRREKRDGDGDEDHALTTTMSRLEATEDGRALSLLDEPLTWDTCHVRLRKLNHLRAPRLTEQDEQLPIFATAVVALTHVANGLNELQKGVIDLVGVKEMGHFEKAQERWARQDTA
jgi:hypothetical protein